MPARFRVCDFVNGPFGGRCHCRGARIGSGLLGGTSMLPNFAIVGAQKSGTKTLHHALARHSEIFMPREPEEIHFFDLDENYEKGLEWYDLRS